MSTRVLGDDYEFGTGRARWNVHHFVARRIGAFFLVYCASVEANLDLSHPKAADNGKSEFLAFNRKPATVNFHFPAAHCR